MQTNPPEPEFFFAIFGVGVIFFVCAMISLCIFYLGRKQNSKALKITAALPMLFATALLVPATRMFWAWVSYWLLGNR